MTRDEKNGMEQLLSIAAEMGLITQVDNVEKINVDVRTNLIDMVQGQADSVSVSAEGLVMQKDIRVQEMEMQADRISIDPLSAVFGDIKLSQPVGAVVRILLAEKDINRALKSNYVRSKMTPISLNVDGEIVTLELQEMEIHLPGESKIECSGKIRMIEAANTRQLNFIAGLKPRTSLQPLSIEAFQCTHGEGISLELIIPLVQKLKELANLPYFEMEGSAFRVKDMDVQAGSLTVYAEAYVNQIPS